MKRNPTTDQMKRGEFLRSLGMSSAALMAFYCMGTTLTSCSKSSDDPTPAAPTPSTGITGNADTSKGAINFTLDLADANFSKLKTVGQYVSVGNVLVANAKGTLVAVSRDCTHYSPSQGQLDYRATENDFMCNNHGSLFTTDGKVKANQPSSNNVAQYKATLSTDGNKLAVAA